MMQPAEIVVPLAQVASEVTGSAFCLPWTVAGALGAAVTGAFGIMWKAKENQALRAEQREEAQQRRMDEMALRMEERLDRLLGKVDKAS